jgi:hypothetical protein
MSRVALTLAVFLGLAAWAGAQGPPPGLDPARNRELLRTNRALLNQLIDHGVELGGADSPLKRATICRESVRWLAGEVGEAVAAENPDRVTELGGHLEAMIRDGLAPNLDNARQTITPESPDWARLKATRENALGDLDGVRDALAAPGKVGDHAKVKDLRGKLDGLRERLK